MQDIKIQMYFRSFIKYKHLCSFHTQLNVFAKYASRMFDDYWPPRSWVLLTCIFFWCCYVFGCDDNVDDDARDKKHFIFYQTPPSSIKNETNETTPRRIKHTIHLRARAAHYHYRT